MTKFDVFVSSPWATQHPAADFVRVLREHGLSVFHSPPWNREDAYVGASSPRWDWWYGPNLDKAMADARSIVFVVDAPDWEASSWMIHEIEAATRAQANSMVSVYNWNPNAVPIVNPNMAGRMGVELPHLLAAAVNVVTEAMRNGM